MRRVLNHRLSLIRKGKIPASMPESESQYIDGIIGAIYRRKMSSADIEEYIRNLERKIEKLGIKVDHYNVLSNITIDSKELKKYFKDKLLKYVNTKKLDEYDLDVDIDTIIAEEDIPKHLQDMVYRKCEIDLKTIQYISNQRRGDKFNLSDAKILMISCDWRYANYSYNPDIPQRINEVFLEDRLTNILWIKNPKLGDDIPLELTLSVYKASDSVDFKVFAQFNEYLGKLKERDAESFNLVGDILSNQQVLRELRILSNEENSINISDNQFQNIVKIAIDKNKAEMEVLQEELDEFRSEKEEKNEKLRIVQERLDRLDAKYSTETEISLDLKVKKIVRILTVYPIGIGLLLSAIFRFTLIDSFRYAFTFASANQSIPEFLKLFAFPELIVLILVVFGCLFPQRTKDIARTYCDEDNSIDDIVIFSVTKLFTAIGVTLASGVIPLLGVVF